ncbi:MAG TPA: CBS domain-containing protein [Dissulfurispiraceae bacterium]|nr:CBS domain-containing protein [Dissulfurispiraceae bacterium]
MEPVKTVKDVMEDIFEFPHLPYWFSLRQAIDIIKVTSDAVGVRDFPRAILVFDEKYNLLGTLDIRDILRGLSPSLKGLRPGEPMPKISELYSSSGAELMERPVSEFMQPAELFLNPDDPLGLAAYYMVTQARAYLPVLEDKKRLVGIVKMMDVFNTVTASLIED